MHAGIDTANLDRDTRPQDDLFRHVNGGWLSRTQIPADRGRYGSFDRLREKSEEDVRTLIEESAAQAGDAPAGSPQRQVGDLYASFMDTETIADRGWEPLSGELTAIANAQDLPGFLTVLGSLQRCGISGLVHFWVTADAGNPQEYITYLHQGGLGMPDEAYYREEEHKKTREAYREYLRLLVQLSAPALEQAGLPATQESADQVMELETRLAAAHWDRVTARDAEKAYTRVQRGDLDELTVGLDWDALAAGLQVPDGAWDAVVARQPSFLAGLAAILRDTDLDIWRSWLALRVLDETAPFLSEEMVEAHFDFHGRTLSGTPKNRDRWRRGVALVEELLGEAAGQLYVQRHYPPEAAERMDELVANVVQSFRVRIGELEWMGEETKARALEKLEAFHPKVGHPPTWRDYSSYRVDAADLVGNVRRGQAFENDRQFAKIGTPIDRDEWLMTPQTVNAYYHPMLNEIVFPAAILQPPFFDVTADDAVNYGGIGAVIAHEIGHGFDDQGSKFAGDGSLTDWWTAEDRAAFETRAAALIAQFDQLEGRDAPGMKVNGGLTVGENIGDLCGLELALSAYRMAGSAPELDGWTGEQRFFLGWAQVWCGKARLEDAKRLLSVDPHSPTDLRANLVRNVDAFHEAFGTVEGDGMWLDPQERVRVF